MKAGLPCLQVQVRSPDYERCQKVLYATGADSYKAKPIWNTQCLHVGCPIRRCIRYWDCATAKHTYHFAIDTPVHRAITLVHQVSSCIHINTWLHNDFTASQLRHSTTECNFNQPQKQSCWESQLPCLIANYIGENVKEWGSSLKVYLKPSYAAVW